MNEHWYCHIAGKTLGPLTDDDLIRMVKSGELTQQTMVCRGLEGNWAAAVNVVGLFPNASPATAAGPGAGAGPQPKPQPDPADSNLRVAKPLNEPAPPVRAAAPAPARPAQPAIARPATPAPQQPAPVRQPAAPPQPVYPAAGQPHQLVQPQPAQAASAQSSMAQVRAAGSNQSAPISTHAKHLRDRRRHRNSGIVITITTVGVAGVLLIVVLGLTMSANNKKSSTLGEDAVVKKTIIKKPSRRDGKATPQARANGQRVVTASADVQKSVDAMLKLTPQQVVEKVTDFREISFRPRIGEVELEVREVWLSGDNPTNYKLFVTVAITNTSTRVRRPVTSWNSLRAKGETASPLLVNGSGDVLALRARGEQPDVVLEPGEMTTEHLGFAYPVDLNELKLVLPFTALGRTGQYGFVIKSEQIRRGGDPPAANNANNNVAQASPEKDQLNGAGPLVDGKMRKAAVKGVNKALNAASNAPRTNPPGANPPGANAGAGDAIKSTVGQLPKGGLFSGAAKNGDQPGSVDELKNAIEGKNKKDSNK